jgi:hypothetical protein
VTASVLALRAGRIIEAVIVAVLAVPSLVLLALWLLAWKRGLVNDDGGDEVAP